MFLSIIKYEINSKRVENEIFYKKVTTLSKIRLFVHLKIWK